MTALNILGSQAVARAQTVVVIVVIGILIVFSVATLANLDLDLLAFSGYPSLRDIVSSVALTFFAFLGFGVITFTAKDLADPPRQLPRAIYLALGIATVVYVAVALGVFGTLTVDEVVASGGTALAVAAEPVLGSAGYWLMSVTALFATAGATNSGLYPAAGLAEQMAAVGQFPPVMGRRVGGRAPMGILVTAAAAMVLAIFFDLNAIASIGSAVALVVFTLVTFGHLRIRHETGAQAWLLVLADLSTVVVLVAFAFTTLVDEPGTAVALVVILPWRSCSTWCGRAAVRIRRLTAGRAVDSHAPSRAHPTRETGSSAAAGAAVVGACGGRGGRRRRPPHDLAHSDAHRDAAQSGARGDAERGGAHDRVGVAGLLGGGRERPPPTPITQRESGA